MHARHALAVILEGGLLGKQQVAPMRGCVGKPAACFLGELGTAGDLGEFQIEIRYTGRPAVQR